jgi:hypothetical protein
MQFVCTLLNGYSGGLGAEAEHVGDLQILRVPTEAQFHCYVFHFYLAPTCFRLTAIIRELTPILLKYNLQSTFYNILNIQILTIICTF